ELKDVFASRKQTIRIERGKEVPAVYIDESRMRMVLENLIDNASKYTDHRGRILISLSQTKTRVIISVKDTGVGIAKQDLKCIFKKFSRMPNRLSDEAGGSGLGLYWAKKIVTLHKGSIQVISKIDVGTEFRVKIPKGTNHA
ncbi:MAG TPA: ATP-binding protein, partial [Candidatus Saccharimonadales bacterium]|nr:ATP-binding protein [Candidatus Saccharimonadales bacterium]